MTRQARSLVLAQQTGWVEREKKVEPRIKEHRGWQNTCKTRNTCLYVYTHCIYMYTYIHISVAIIVIIIIIVAIIIITIIMNTNNL